MHNYVPFYGIYNLQIPESSIAFITKNLFNNDYQIQSQLQQSSEQQQEQIIHFRTSYNYFNVLQNEMNLLINETFTNSELNEIRLKRINAGLKVLNQIIRNIETTQQITDEIVQPIEMCIDILLKFKNLSQPPIELFANCLNIFTTLLPLFSTEILIRILNLNILPIINNKNLDYKKYANGVGFDSSLCGSYLINIEKKYGKYDFLMSYLNFLRECLKVS